MSDARFVSGFLWSLASAFLWATTFVAARYLLDGKLIDSATLTFFRFAIAGAILIIWGLITARKRLLAVSAADLARLAGLGLIGIVGQGLLLFIGLEKTTAINGSMVMQLNPLMILLGGCLIGEKITIRNTLGLLTSLVGCMIVVEVLDETGFHYQGNHVSGDLFVLGAAACWAAYSVMGKSIVHRLGGFVTTAWAMAFAGIELAAIWLLTPEQYLTARIYPATAISWSLVGYIAILPSAVAFLAYYKALRRIPLALLNIMQYLTPVFTIILAWLLINESISPLRILGVVLVLLGVWISGIISPKQKTKAP